MTAGSADTTAAETGEMKDRFEEIYAKNAWRHGSGSGSLPKHTRGYVKRLQRFLKDRSIRSVVDFGCGDWQFSQSIDWSGLHYTGFDIVSSVIEENRARFTTPGVEFRLFGGDFAELPDADLLIVKDVLQHWSNEAIHRFLPVLSRYKYSLVTNCVNPTGETENVDIEDGGFRYLDLRRPPFGVAADDIYAFTNRRQLLLRPFKKVRWLKRVLLVKGG
ncbi:MAG: class I SAM-dependent methyltransferase [Planctomycetota bacterium]